MAEKTLTAKLATIQQKLKAPKGQYNSFAKFNYRSAEDIVEAAKPLVHEQQCILLLSDTVVHYEGRYYVEATVKILDGASEIAAKGIAREEETKKGMDAAQITGSASSYARKYALNGLFAIDDTKDADSMDNRSTAPKKQPVANIEDQAPFVKELQDLISDIGVSSDPVIKGEFFRSAIGKDKPQTLNEIKKAIEYAKEVQSQMNDKEIA